MKIDFERLKENIGNILDSIQTEKGRRLFYRKDELLFGSRGNYCGDKT